jgi:hypothetical protein
MSKEDLIKVLWVENDPITIEGYRGEADVYENIELVDVPSWEDAKLLLDKDYNCWKAIILDAKCQFKRTDTDKADRFLSNVIPDLGQYANRNRRTIPWYVLSGQSEEAIRDLIPISRLAWDSEWDKKTHRPFYSKVGMVEWNGTLKHERHILLERIIEQVKLKDTEYRLRNDICFDVFSALNELNEKGLSSMVNDYLVALLEPIYFNHTTNQDYNRRYIDLRKALELIFRNMASKSILPPILISSKKDKDEVNLSWCSLFLGSNQPDQSAKAPKGGATNLWDIVKRNVPNPLLPRQLADWLKMAIFQAGGAAHTSEVEEQICMNLENYLPHVDQSPYMLRSLAMGLCDFILWYRRFLDEHPDEEMNAVAFWTLKNEKY